MARRGWIAIGAIAAAIVGAPPAAAHIGSPDVFLDGHAGPYRLLITVRPPHAIPGVADVEVLAPDGVQGVRIVPLPLAGVGAQFAPVPDVASRSMPIGARLGQIAGRSWPIVARWMRIES